MRLVVLVKLQRSHLLKGYRLFLVARNPTRASATEKLVRLKAKDAEVHWLMGDLASLVDVRNIAGTFLSFDEV